MYIFERDGYTNHHARVYMILIAGQNRDHRENDCLNSG